MNQFGDFSDDSELVESELLDSENDEPQRKKSRVSVSTFPSNISLADADGFLGIDTQQLIWNEQQDLSKIIEFDREDPDLKKFLNKVFDNISSVLSSTNFYPSELVEVDFKVYYLRVLLNALINHFCDKSLNPNFIELDIVSERVLQNDEFKGRFDYAVKMDGPNIYPLIIEAKGDGSRNGLTQLAVYLKILQQLSPNLKV